MTPSRLSSTPDTIHHLARSPLKSTAKTIVRQGHR